MPYIGNTTPNNFVSVVKDLFSGDGSTVAFTLSKASTTNGVAVFVENVRQEPTIAYAVSGTTLTFTAAPVTSSGNNIYVLHHNAPASTVTHPAAQNLSAVTGNFTGGVNLTGTTPTLTIGDAGAEDSKIVFDGNAQDYHIGLDDSTDSLTIGKGSALGTTAHIVSDANGHVTMPLQSGFLASFSTTNSNIALNSAVHQYFDSEIYDNNGDYASNTFTAPVTGKYLLQVRVRVDNLPTDPAYIWFYLQTSNRVHTVDFFDPDNFDGGGVYYTVQGTIIADMDASDTATFNINQSGGSQVTDLDSGFFSGHLLG